MPRKKSTNTPAKKPAAKKTKAAPVASAPLFDPVASEAPTAAPTMPPPAPAPAPRPAARRKLGLLRNLKKQVSVRGRAMGRAAAKNKGTMAAAVGAGSVAGMLALSKLLKAPDVETSIQIETAVREAERRARSERIAQLIGQSQDERAIMENEARLARSLPDLYTSILAGRSVPAGSIVLGGRPRKDLMRELAASMGSGRFDKQDPLSELIG